MIGRRRARAGASPRSGFSLIEVLMSIFILAIGVISIAALFPAGIAQQQRSADEVMGPIVANNALAILRSKLSQEDFGTFELFDRQGSGVRAPRPTIPGDWTWLRPSVLFPSGAIDIFSHAFVTSGSPLAPATEFPRSYEYEGAQTDPPLFGIPFVLNSFADDGQRPPEVVITQRERYFPMASSEVSGAPVLRPQYVWDCMFRRFQGRVMVAIFVYRVNAPGGEGASGYALVRNSSNDGIPPLPIWLDLSRNDTPDPWDATGPDPDLGNGNDAIVASFPDPGCDGYDPFDDGQTWQQPGQWILDQNGDVHRVLSSYCLQDVREVELIRPVSPALDIPGRYNTLTNQSGLPGLLDVVSDIWYLPAHASERRLTPVYVLVEGL